jgi:hypothetical protein
MIELYVIIITVIELNVSKIESVRKETEFL